MNLKELEKENQLRDANNDQVPECLYWNVDQVCEHFEYLGLPQYKVRHHFYAFDQ